PEVIALLSRHTTLRAGDVIALGTPSGVSPLKPGDVVEVEVEGVGTLRNPVELAPAPATADKPRLFAELLPRITEAIDTSRDGGDAFERVVDLLDGLPHFHWTGIYRVEPDGSLGLGPFRGKPTEHVKIAPGKGVCGRAIAQDATVVVDDVTSDPAYLACSIETRSEIVVPIRAHGKPVAEIDVDSDAPGAFDARDREMLEAVASRLGRFLETTHLPRMWDER
ncbi:MAG TPA: fumarylacetoacetate hydrolase family protein, partial [Planctomycetota bacterium]|nr:fumarylacetoacetate hydrolase family protein [Planctomycetota bacterium]